MAEDRSKAHRHALPDPDRRAAPLLRTGAVRLALTNAGGRHLPNRIPYAQQVIYHTIQHSDVFAGIGHGTSLLADVLEQRIALLHPGRELINRLSGLRRIYR